jgi:hypothetical protein
MAISVYATGLMVLLGAKCSVLAVVLNVHPNVTSVTNAHVLLSFAVRGQRVEAGVSLKTFAHEAAFLVAVHR